MADKPTNDFSDVHAVLAHVQANLHAPKTQFNKFGNYYFRNCEDIFDGLKKVLPAGAAVTVTDDIVMVGTRTYVKAVATITFKGQSLSNTAFAREEEQKKGMDAAQVTGATSSYARKYALNGLFMIDDVKDADSQNNAAEAPKPAKQQTKQADKPDFNALGIAITAAQNMDELKKAFVAAVSKARSSGDKSAVDAFTKLKDDRKAELEAANV